MDRESEYYPRGGMSHLVSKSICYTNLLLTTHQKRGVKMLKDAGMSIILDHHGLPGVQTSDQAFAGQCTTNVQFYVRSPFDCEAKDLSMLTLPQTPYNYQRALVWTAVMTAVSHLDPDFGAVFSIQAVNEPIMDATLSPGYGDCMRATLTFPVPQISSYFIPSPEAVRADLARGGVYLGRWVCRLRPRHRCEPVGYGLERHRGHLGHHWGLQHPGSRSQESYLGFHPYPCRAFRQDGLQA